MRVVTLLGTRPEIIRLSRVIESLDRACDHILVDSGQNFDERLNAMFYRDLGVREPNERLNIRATSFGDQVGQLLARVQTLFEQTRPDTVLVLGDTNTGLAAIVAKRMGLRVAHMEAGNRCYDDAVPEELNRRVIDNCSSVLMPYTHRSAENLVREGFDRARVYVTGNPTKEVLDHYDEQIGQAGPFAALDIEPGGFFLVTVHRAETVDNPERLRALVETLNAVGRRYEIPLIASLHPRTADRLTSFGIDPGLIRFVPPIGLFDFVKLEKTARCVLSDSGTVQEEACIFGVPTVTLRDVTERPETIECGSNILAGVEAERVLPAIELVLNERPNWTPPAEYMATNVSSVVTKIVLGLT